MYIIVALFFMHNNHNPVHYFGPTKRILEIRKLLQILGWYYVVEVTVESLGVVRFQNKTFGMYVVLIAIELLLLYD